jgi:hypothetical protein
MPASARADDAIAHHLARAEGEHAARRDRHFDTGLGIAADALALVAQHEGPEAGYLDVLALGQRFAHMAKDLLDQLGRIGTRKPHLMVQRFGQIGPRQCPHRCHLQTLPRWQEVNLTQ